MSCFNMADDVGKGFSPSETTNGGDNSQSDTLLETKLDLESVSLVPGVKLRPGVAPIKTQ